MEKESCGTSRREFLKCTGALALAAATGPASSASEKAAAGSGDRQVLGFPFRQVHLDFHTSEHIEGVGDDFDPERFSETLVRAHVNSVTCFGRCHHGYIYYNTKKFRERRHPHLKRDLLNEQIEACHKRGIRVPIYTTIQWDHYTANQHPEWLCVNPDGSVQQERQGEPGFYRYLCVNTPYRDFVKALLEEMFGLVPVDGLFLDIVKPRPCFCNYCRGGMEKQGLDPRKEEDREKYGLQVINGFLKDMTGFIRKLDKDCSIFYNGGHVGPRMHDVVQYYSHLELESLPSGGWGYLHFPLTVRYARKLTDKYLGMTGKFHTSWGDFHSFKNPPALQFECFTMLAQGARCSIGDQLHPRGVLDEATYELIGSVYSEVEKKEPWCEGANPVTEIAVFSPEEFVGGRRPPSGIGTVRMLQEGAHQFDIIDTRMDFSKYKVLILPDVITVSGDLARRIAQFLEAGGAVIASHQSGLNEKKDGFNLKALGVEYLGDAPYSPDFIVPQGKIGKGLKPTEHVMYMKGAHVKAVDGAKVLADVVVPYFNRTFEHFCSHRHTPSAGKVGYPGIVRNGRCIYFAHPIFTQYNQNAPRWCKRLVLNALDILLPQPLLRHDGPSNTVATITEQPEHKRWIVHLLNYIPERRGEDFDTIEDIIPIQDLRVSVRAPGGVKGVSLVPQKKSLEFKQVKGRVEFTVPKLVGHQMIELSVS